MALHFTRDEFADRQRRAREEMAKAGLDGLLIFRQESMYYLTGYDTSGYSMFQGMYLASGRCAGAADAVGRPAAGAPHVGDRGHPHLDRPRGRGPGGRTARHGRGLRRSRKADRRRIPRLRPHRAARQDGRRRVRRLLRAGRRLRSRAAAAPGQEPGRTGVSTAGGAARRRGVRGIAAHDGAGGFGRRRLRRDDEHDHARRRRPERQPLADGRRRGGAARPLPHRSRHGGAARPGAVRDRRRVSSLPCGADVRDPDGRARPAPPPHVRRLRRGARRLRGGIAARQHGRPGVRSACPRF